MERTETELSPLVTLALERLGMPVDAYAVAAILESYGLRDVDAVNQYGRRDIFDLAQAVFASCRDKHLSDARSESRIAALASRHQPKPDRRVRFLPIYAGRLLYSAPWVLQLIALLLRGYALGVYVDFTTAQATLAIQALIASLIVSGGFMQAIGRALSLHPPSLQPDLARRIYWRIILGAIGGLLIGGIVCFALNALTTWFGSMQIGSFLAYYTLFGLMWLSSAGLYALALPAALIGSTIAGVLALGIAFDVLGMPIFTAHWIGLGVASAAGFGSVIWRFGQLHKRSGNTGAIQPGDLPSAKTLLPYFCYGALYFVFLFLDRLVGWSYRVTNGLILFRPSYEIGMVLALIPLFLTLPLLEFFAHRGIWNLDTVQRKFSAMHIDRHNRFFFRRYLRDALWSALSYWFLAGAIGLIAILGAGLNLIPPLNMIVQEVFFTGAIGYGFLVIGLFNGILLFTIGYPWDVVRGLALASLINAIVGLFMSRTTTAYWASITGLLAGSVVFALITFVMALPRLRKIDYYGYASG